MKIIREPSTIHGVFGTLYDDMDVELCKTAERPWLLNQSLISCIPVGTYAIIPHDSPDHPHTWELIHVPNRSGILIHPGNFPMTDSEGCILVGMDWGTIDGVPCVTGSQDAMTGLRQQLPNFFNITIAWRQ